MTAVLVVVGGLPATGKSTVAHALAERTHTPYLRVDRVEQAIVEWSSLSHPVGPVGYAVAHQLAAEQLILELDVIVECVNPVAMTRDSWIETGRSSNAAVVEVEVICSDPLEHRRRVEGRASDVAGLVKPIWAEVLERDYESWVRPHLVLDTAILSVQAAVERILAEIEQARHSPVVSLN